MAQISDLKPAKPYVAEDAVLVVGGMEIRGFGSEQTLTITKRVKVPSVIRCLQIEGTLVFSNEEEQMQKGKKGHPAKTARKVEITYMDGSAITLSYATAVEVGINSVTIPYTKHIEKGISESRKLHLTKDAQVASIDVFEPDICRHTALYFEDGVFTHRCIQDEGHMNPHKEGIVTYPRRILAEVDLGKHCHSPVRL